MQFSWLTFAFELVNFVALTWVLTRVLYRPVRAAIEARQSQARTTLAKAEQARGEAAALESRYAGELARWKRGEADRRSELSRELAAERARRLQRVDEELRAEREAEGLARARRVEEERRRLEAEAIHLAASFASRLLGELAGPELHHRILERFVADVATLPAEVVRPVNGATIEVRSAYPLDAAEREGIARAFAELLHASVRIEVHDAPELIAGIEVRVGAAALEANVERELRFFADAAHV